MILGPCDCVCYRLRRFWLVAVMFDMMACSSDPERPPVLEATGTERMRWVPPLESCDIGTTTECKVYLGQQGDVRSCFVGVKVCVDGVFSICMSAEDAEALLETLDDVVDPP